MSATTATKPPPRVPDEPPRRPGRLLWSKPLSEGAEVVVDGAYLAVAQREGFVVRELLSGAKRWHYHVPEWRLEAMVAGGGRLAVLWDPRTESQEVEYHLTVFRLDSGRKLWSKPLPSAEVVMGVYGDLVVVAPEAGEWRLGEVDAVTAFTATDGVRAWSRPLTCGATEMAGWDIAMSEHAIGVSVTCQLPGKETSLVSKPLPHTSVAVLDPATGRGRWRKTVDRAAFIRRLGPDLLVTATDGNPAGADFRGYDVLDGGRVRLAVESSGYGLHPPDWCLEAGVEVMRLRCYRSGTGERRQWVLQRGAFRTPVHWGGELLAALCRTADGNTRACVLDRRSRHTSSVDLPRIGTDADVAIVSFAHGALVVRTRVRKGSDYGLKRIHVYGERG